MEAFYLGGLNGGLGGMSSSSTPAVRIQTLSCAPLCLSDASGSLAWKGGFQLAGFPHGRPAPPIRLPPAVCPRQACVCVKRSPPTQRLRCGTRWDRWLRASGRRARACLSACSWIYGGGCRFETGLQVILYWEFLRGEKKNNEGEKVQWKNGL